MNKLECKHNPTTFIDEIDEPLWLTEAALILCERTRPPNITDSLNITKCHTHETTLTTGIGEPIWLTEAVTLLKTAPIQMR